MVMKKKSSSGRQKIPIEKIPNRSHLQVTFSKRRSGLFKKASELCTLCGVEIAIIVFSPAEKAFSFGHPEVESILDRYLTRNPLPRQESRAHQQLVEAHRNAHVHEQNMKLTQILNQLEIEKKRGEELDQIRVSNSQRDFWWERPIDQLGMSQLQELKVSLQELKENISKHQANKILIDNSNKSSSSPFFVANSVGNFDTYETKPTTKINYAASSTCNVYNFGYGHGYL